MDYQNTLVDFRSNLNKSQKELSKLLVVSFSPFNRWKKGRCAPTKIVKLLKLFKHNCIEMEE